MTKDDAAATVQRLRELHLVIGDNAVGLHAVSPEIALARRVDDDERRLRELQSEVSKQRMAYAQLMPHFSTATATTARNDSIEVVEDVPTITSYLADLCRTVRDELLIAQPTRRISAKSLVEGVPQDLEMLARGVIRKNLYVASNRVSAAVRNAVAECEEAGAEYRTIAAIPLRIMCFDGTTALVSRSSRRSDRAAIIIRDPDIVQVLRTIYLTVWESAEPFAAPESTAPAAADVALVNALAHGLTDEQVARRLGISVRTCGRHIRALMDAIGATSRFQAGVMLAGEVTGGPHTRPAADRNAPRRDVAATKSQRESSLPISRQPTSSQGSVRLWP